MEVDEVKSEAQWNVVMEALAAANVSTETVELVRKYRALSSLIESAGILLQKSADVEHAKNYIKIDMVGMLPPFDRAYIELLRPEGKSSHELRLLLRKRLKHIHYLLLAGTPSVALQEEMIKA